MSITINLSDIDLGGYGVKVYTYKKGQMTMPTDSGVYGSDKKNIFIEPNTTYTMKYRIIQDDILAIDQKFQKCRENPDDSQPSVSQCIVEYMENKVKN